MGNTGQKLQQILNFFLNAEPYVAENFKVLFYKVFWKYWSVKVFSNDFLFRMSYEAETVKSMADTIPL